MLTLLPSSLPMRCSRMVPTSALSIESRWDRSIVLERYPSSRALTSHMAGPVRIHLRGVVDRVIGLYVDAELTLHVGVAQQLHGPLAAADNGNGRRNSSAVFQENLAADELWTGPRTRGIQVRHTAGAALKLCRKRARLTQRNNRRPKAYSAWSHCSLGVGSPCCAVADCSEINCSICFSCPRTSSASLAVPANLR